MKEFEFLYQENKKFDKIIDDTYGKGKTIIEKNILELLVELGELANETRCFKFWSVKKSSEKEIVLEEYADCFIMGLYFAYIIDLDLNENFEVIKNDDIISQFQNLFQLTSQLSSDIDKSIVKKILSNLLNLGHLLGFNNKDIIDGCLLKLEKNKMRLQTNY